MLNRVIESAYNYVLVVSVLSWFTAQVIKTVVHLVRFRKFSVERLTGAGGMPSSHSALVCAMTIAVSRKTGVSSPEFAIAFLFSLVVMYDAMGVRRAAGLHAKEINRMRRQIAEYEEEFSAGVEGEGPEEDEESVEIPPKPYRELKEYLGHTPLEVLGGALLGILIAMAFAS